MASTSEIAFSSSVCFPKTADSGLKRKLHELEKIDNFYGFVRLAGNYSIFAIAIVLTYFNPFFYPISVILIGSRLRALENLTHEASHCQLFKNRYLNDWLSTLLGAFPTHVSLGQYRKGHRIHHLHLGDPEKDPDLAKYGYLPVPKNRKLRHLIAVFTATYDLKQNLTSFIQSFAQPASTLELILRLIFWLICFLLITITHNWLAFILFYLIPLLTSYRVIRQLVDMSEHILANDVVHHTRNVLCHPILRFIVYPHADYLHLLHHIHPSIPGNALPKAHQLLLTDPAYTDVPPFTSYFLGNASVFSAAFRQ